MTTFGFHPFPFRWKKGNSQVLKYTPLSKETKNTHQAYTMGKGYKHST
jgi:hypothetical protein